MDAEDPLYILYTSGSTGTPKGVLHTTGGYLLQVAMTFKYTFDYHDGEVFWCAADVGWVTAHSYIVYGPLCNGATTLLFESVPTYPDAGRIAEDEGCRWIAVHGRTAKQMYSGRADWTRIAELKTELSIPVLGNGDIFRAEDALRRMRETGVDGVVIGRGCLGKPWLFRDLRLAYEGRDVPPRPPDAEVVAIVREHFRLLREHFCVSDRDAILRMRKFGTWYAAEFPGAVEFRRRFQKIDSEGDLEEVLEAWLARAHDRASEAAG